jgi:prohibitin 2
MLKGEINMEDYEIKAEVKKVQEKGKAAGKIILLAVVGIIVIAILNPFVIVNAGERGVVKQFGNVQDDVWDEGLHIKVPIRDTVINMDVKTQKYETDATAASNDMQITKTTVAVNYHLVPSESNIIYQEVGESYESKIIAPAIQEVVKAATANFKAEELITQRPIVKDEIEMSLKEKMLQRGIVIETVYITNFDFSPEFNTAIELKVKAQQMALQAENDLLRIKVEAKQKITQAEAEAESIRIIQEQLSMSPQYVNYLTVMRWDGVLPKVTGGAIPLISVEAE